MAGKAMLAIMVSSDDIASAVKIARIAQRRRSQGKPSGGPSATAGEGVFAAAFSSIQITPERPCTTAVRHPTATTLHDAYAMRCYARSGATFGYFPLMGRSNRLSDQGGHKNKLISAVEGKRFGGCTATRPAHRGRAERRRGQAPERACRRVDRAAAGDPRLSRHLSRPHLAARRAHRHQSGGGWPQPQPSLDRQFP